MSPPKPSITLITLGAITNNALMVALFNHFNGGDSIYFQPVLDGGLNPIENGFTPGEDSFLIEPVDSDESWQVNFRRTANDRGLVMIDPGNGITDSGTIPDPPVGATDQASGEVDYPWDMSVASDEVFVLEWSDSLMVLPIASVKTYVSRSCYIGRIHSPFKATDTENGLDGLGLLCGKPFLSETSVADSWATATTTTQQIRIGVSSWTNTVTAWRSTTGANVFVGIRPDGILLRYQGRPIGVLQYVLNFTGSAEVPFERVFDSGGIAQYLYFFDAAAISTQVLPWVDGTPGPTP